MTIGTALVVIAVLYFIDKYHLWKKAAIALSVILLITLAGLTGYYAWEKFQEREASKRKVIEEATEKNTIDLSAGLVANWDIPPPPKGFISEDVSYAILYPVKADSTAKTDAWFWYRDSNCGVLGNDPLPSASRIIHKNNLFDLQSYDDRWMKEVKLPERVKQALWSAKAEECRLPRGAKNVKSCLNRAKGTVLHNPFADLGAEAAWCIPEEEMVYLSGSREVGQSANSK